MSRVVLSPTTNGLEKAVHHIFSHFNGGRSLLKKSGEVYIKVNGVDFKPHCYTTPGLLREVVRFFYDQGATKVYVIENSTQGNMTRMVFNFTGITRVCKETGAVPIYLDEEPTVQFQFAGKPSVQQDSHGYDRTLFEMSRTVAETLIKRREEITYVNIPKFKTHSMSVVTLGIKNQWGFVRHHHRIEDHNYNLHSKLVDVAQLVQPDFTLIDAQEAVIHGHWPPEALLDENIVPFNLLIGGTDMLATDMTGARLLGITPEEVEHLEEARRRKIGYGSWDEIEIVGDLSHYRKKYSHRLVDRFPPDVLFVEGEDLCCNEGCGGNTRAVLQGFYLDHQGKGGFSIIIGKGHDRKKIEKISGPCLVAGKCAVKEVGDVLSDRLGKKRVYIVDGCNNLTQVVTSLLKLMKLSPFALVPSNPLYLALPLVQARLRGSKAIIPPLLFR